MRSYYSDYVNHCLRFYARHPEPTFKSVIDRQNWKCCQTVFDRFSESDRDIFYFVYNEGGTIAENVFDVSARTGIKQQTVWKLISELERQVAKERGLI